MGGIGSGGCRRNAGRRPEDGENKVKFSLRLPAWLSSLIKEEASRLQVTETHLITELITKGIER